MFLYFISNQIYKQSYLKKHVYVIVLQLQDSIKRMYEECIVITDIQTPNNVVELSTGQRELQAPLL